MAFGLAEHVRVVLQASIEAAELLKKEGNALYAAGDVEAAAVRASPYHCALCLTRLPVMLRRPSYAWARASPLINTRSWSGVRGHRVNVKPQKFLATPQPVRAALCLPGHARMCARVSCRGRVAF